MVSGLVGWLVGRSDGWLISRSIGRLLWPVSRRVQNIY